MTNEPTERQAALLAAASRNRSWIFGDMGVLDYRKAHELQLRLVAAKSEGILSSDILLLGEHAPVFTLGRRGGRENLTVPEHFLNEAQIPVIQVERGGDITFHGPGQLVGYPILDLRAAGLSIAGYVERLEEVMIRTAACWGVHAVRNPLNHGIWAGERKLGSLGIAIRRGIAFHGFALNVSVSLELFEWINPCGLEGVKMTSMEREIAQAPPGGPAAPSMQQIRERIKACVEDLFGVHLDMEVPSSCSMSCVDLPGGGK